MNELAVRLAGVLAELGAIDLSLRLHDGSTQRMQAGRDDLVGAVLDGAQAGMIGIECHRPHVFVQVTPAMMAWRTPDDAVASAFTLAAS